MTSRIALVLPVTVLLGACTVSGTDLRSMPTLGSKIAEVPSCPKQPGVFYAPPSGGSLCFSIYGVQMEVEAQNSETIASAIGPLFPVLPYFPKRNDSGPLAIDLAFNQTEEPYAFSPWEVSVQTDRGETVGVSRVSTNVREGQSVRTVALDPREKGARMLGAGAWSRFFLTFEKHIAPEQPFSLTLHLRATNGADVQLPTISFKNGKVSYLGTIP